MKGSQPTTNHDNLGIYKPLKGKSYTLPINPKEYHDGRKLADQMREAIEEFEAQNFATSEDKEDVVETLRTFYDLTVDLRNGSTYAYGVEFNPDSEDFVNDMKTVAQELEDIQNAHGPKLIHETYFEESIKELGEDDPDIVTKIIPDIIIIDWRGHCVKSRGKLF